MAMLGYNFRETVPSSGRLVCRLNDCVRVDHRFAHPYEPVTKSLRAHALRRDARAFEQQEQFVRQHVRLGERSRGAQLNEPLALSGLERLNHLPRRMVLFRQFDGGIGQRAATLVPAGHVGGHVLEPGTELCGGVTPMVGLEPVPRQLGPRVAKKLGDGLMVLFGYPAAQENDAERAVRAALSIQRALAELNRKNEDTGKPPLAARIAIDLGPVVVDATGEIFGDVPNVAARAQALGEPGSVVVTARVQHQVAGLFVAEERGSHELKGVPEPVALYRIVRASGAGRRAGQRHLTPLVGRDEEIAMLLRRWERARRGDGQFMLVIGEPGLGKSRLLEEFHDRLRDTPHTWTEWSFLQLLQNTPLHPITEWGRQRFGGSDVPAERRRADLENSLAQVKLDPTENIPLLAPLLDIPLPQDRAPPQTAEVRAHRALRPRLPRRASG
jgi:class 3 adenylate cyclase